MTTGHVTHVRTLPSTRRKRAAMNERIERLGQLNDRRRDAENMGDFAELEKIAGEYAALGIFQKANEIRREI